MMLLEQLIEVILVLLESIRNLEWQVDSWKNRYNFLDLFFITKIKRFLPFLEVQKLLIKYN